MAARANSNKIKIEMFTTLDNKAALKSIDKLTQEVKDAQADIEKRSKAISTSRANEQGKTFKKMQRNLQLAKTQLALKKNELHMIQMATGAYRTVGKSIKANVLDQKQMNAQTELAIRLMKRATPGGGKGKGISGSEEAATNQLSQSKLALANSKKKVVKWTSLEAKSSVKATTAIKESSAAAGKAVGSFDRLGKALKSTGNKFRIVAQFALGAKVIQLFAEGMGAAGEAVRDFDTATRTMSAVLEISLSQAKDLGQGLNQLSKSLGGNQKEIFDVALALGRAGIATEDLLSASEVAIRMARLTGDSFAESTKAIISYQQVFGKDEMGNVVLTIEELGDKLAFVANVSRLSTQDIGTFSNFALAAAKNVGLTVDAVGALAASFSNAGVNASTIGTQIRSLTRIFVSNSQGVTTLFKKLGVVQSNVLRDLQAGPEKSNEAIQKFSRQLQSLSDVDFANFTKGLNKLEGNALALLRQQADNFNKFIGKSVNDVKGQLEDTDVILRGFTASWESNMNKLRDAAVDILHPVAGGLKNIFSDVATGWDLISAKARLSGDEYEDYLEKWRAQLKLQNLIIELEAEQSASRRADLEVQINLQKQLLDIQDTKLKKTQTYNKLDDLILQKQKLQASLKEAEESTDKDKNLRIKVYTASLKSINTSMDSILKAQFKGIENLDAELGIAKAIKQALVEQAKERRNILLSGAKHIKYGWISKEQGEAQVETDQRQIAAQEYKIALIKKEIAAKKESKTVSVESVAPVDLETFGRTIQAGNKAGLSMNKVLVTMKELVKDRSTEERGYQETLISNSGLLEEQQRHLQSIVSTAVDYRSTTKAIANLTAESVDADVRRRGVIDALITQMNELLKIQQTGQKAVQSQLEFDADIFRRRIETLGVTAKLEILDRQRSRGLLTALGFEKQKLDVLKAQAKILQGERDKAVASGNADKIDIADKAVEQNSINTKKSELALEVLHKKTLLSVEEQHTEDLVALYNSRAAKIAAAKAFDAPRGPENGESFGVVDGAVEGIANTNDMYLLANSNYQDYLKTKEKLIEDQKGLADAEGKLYDVKADPKVQVLDDAALARVDDRIATSDSAAAGGPGVVGQAEEVFQNRLTEINSFHAEKMALLIQNGADEATIQEELLRAGEEREKASAVRRMDQAVGIATELADTLDNLRKSGLVKSKKAFIAMQALQVAAATISTYKSATLAYESAFLPIPTPASPILGGISAAAAIAAGLANVAQIKAQTFHTGGMVGPTGNKLRNDEVPAILQTGEVVLNRNEVAQAQAAPAQSGETVIINSMDPAVIESWASSRAGRKVIRNIVNN